MKKLLLTALLVPAIAFAQTYPSPTFNNVTLQNPLTAANGGTGAVSSTGTGSVVLSNSPTFTGTVTIPSGASINGYLTTTSAASTYAPLSSPTFTGTPTAPTAAAGVSNTQIATTNYVTNQVASGTGAGAFTNLSASGTVFGAGFTSLLAPYAPIASPTFTGTATIPTVNIGAGVINGVSIGAATPFTGRFTTLTATSPISVSSGGTGASIFPAPLVVASIPNLRSVSSATFTSVTTTGYYASGDNGGGSYQYVPGNTSGAYFTGSINSAVLTVSAVANGTMAFGQQINGIGITPSSCYISSFGTGAGGTGTYNLTCSGTVPSETMEADFGGGIIVATDGARWQLVPTSPITAKQYGATGNGTTDDYWPITDALSNAPAVVYLPYGAYRVSQGIVVPAFKALKGQAFGAYASGATNDSAPLIIGDLSIPTIVTVTGGSVAEGVALENVMVNRAAGAVPANSISVAVTNSSANLTVQDVTAMRSGIGFSIGAGTSTTLGVHCLRCYTGQVTQYHVQISNAVETTFTEARLGRNGGLDVNTAAYVNINGAAVDTVRFQTSQFNQGGGQAVFFVSFTGYASNANGIISFEHCHIEQISSSIVNVDSASSAVRRVRFIGNTIDAGAGDLFYNGAAGKLTELMLTGNAMDGGFAMTLDQQTSSVITGNNITGPVLINQGTQVLSGNFFQGNVTLQGATTRTVFVGNGVAGTLSNTMSGNAIVGSNG